MDDRKKLHSVFALLEEQAGIRGDGPVACCQTCGHYELEEEQGFECYVFWHDQSERAFDDDDNLAETLYLYHRGEGVPKRVSRALRAHEFVVEWDGSDGRALQVRRRVELFDPGHALTTPGAVEAIKRNDTDPRELLDRHVSGDWGSFTDDPAPARAAPSEGFSVMSGYTLADDTRLWLYTDGDRLATTFMLPSEY